FRNPLSSSSTPPLRFKRSKRSTPFPAQIPSQTPSKSPIHHALKTLQLTLKPPPPRRESPIPPLQSAGLQVTAIRHLTPLPHNRCRP
ncbi:30S ribosomal protein S11, partial [Staphylococcus capitis]|uniref:30S ribosomal protein S11 n=1 Tax=Staphylococcus capitis TaxID=29388 RepID=UPI0011A147EE